MKKYVFLSITLLLLTGCGNKKLVCEKNDNSIKELKINEKIEINIKKDKVSNIKINNHIKTFGVYKDYKEELKESVINKYSGFDDKNIKVDSNIEKDNINIEIKIDVKNMSEENKKNISIINTDNSYENIKKDLSNKGYKCK